MLRLAVHRLSEAMLPTLAGVEAEQEAQVLQVQRRGKMLAVSYNNYALEQYNGRARMELLQAQEVRKNTHHDARRTLR